MIGYRSYLRSTVLVNTKTEQAFKGILWKSTGPLLVLKDAEKWEGNNPYPVDGEVIIAKDNIDYMQKIS